MNRLTHHVTLVTFAIAALALLAQAAAAAPADSCQGISDDIARTEQQRKEAVEKAETAWKLVVPFAVLARKASSKSAAEEAERQLVVLRKRAADEGCSAIAGDGLALRCAPTRGTATPPATTVDCGALP